MYTIMTSLSGVSHTTTIKGNFFDLENAIKAYRLLIARIDGSGRMPKMSKSAIKSAIRSRGGVVCSVVPHTDHFETLEVWLIRR